MMDILDELKTLISVIKDQRETIIILEHKKINNEADMALIQIELTRIERKLTRFFDENPLISKRWDEFERKLEQEMEEMENDL